MPAWVSWRVATQDGIDGIVLQHPPVVGRRLTETEALPGGGTRQRSGRCDLDEVHIRSAGEKREEHRRGVVAGADDTQPHHRSINGRRGFGREPVFHGHAVHRSCIGVAEEDPDSLDLVFAEALVDLDGPVERVDLGDQASDVTAPISHQIEERLHVPPLGPAYVADRVVHTLFLIDRVVPARAVRAREAQVEFLLVVLVPRKVEVALADVDNARPVTGQPRRQEDGFTRLRRSGQEHVIDPGPIRQPLDL